MSRGKSAFKRGNRTLAWYLGGKLVDSKSEGPEAPELKRKNSVDSQSSMNSAVPEERRKRERRPKQRARKAAEPVEPPQTPLLLPEPEPQCEPELGADALQMSLNGQPPKDRENYWYYDQTSDGFYYEHNGSRGWRKRNPKLHGNPPLTTAKPPKAEEPVKEIAPQTAPHTVEKKVYVPVPVPVFPNQSNKFFQSSAHQNGIKYYDPSTDGFFYEMASVDGWRRRQPSNSQGSSAKPTTRSTPDQMLNCLQMGRDLTNQEVEELVLSNVDRNGTPALNLGLAQLLARQMSKQQNQAAVQSTATQADEYPSSSSTASSAQSDDVTPPPAKADSKEQTVGSFEEPYEFYWSDSEKTDRSLQPASSTSSVDELVANPLTMFFNNMCLESKKRPDSLPIRPEADKRLVHFNVDQFIADLPRMVDPDALINNLSLSTPFPMDSPVGSVPLVKDSPIFTPTNWDRPHGRPNSGAEFERGFRDIEKIWHSGA